MTEEEKQARIAELEAEIAAKDRWIAAAEQQLGIKQTIEERRAKTLARARKHRAAKKAADAGD